MPIHRSAPVAFSVAAAILLLGIDARAEGTPFRTALSLTPLRAIDGAVETGEIDLAEAIRLRDLAVRAPRELPAPWDARFAAAPIPPSAATAVLVENQQWRIRAGLERPSLIPGDYEFPEELPFYLDSAAFPIRVYYASGSEAALAQEVLEGADLSWQKQIVEWGFYSPPLVTPEGRYRIYLGDTSLAAPGATGYVDPFASYTEADWSACVSYMMVSNGCGDGSAGWIVSHELNHAEQAAMDCLEPVAYWENTATFIIAAVYPESGTAAQDSFLGSFQSEPQRSVSGGGGDMDGLYWYGGFLWPHFLAHRFEGEGEAPVFARRTWEGAMQGGNANTTHYMASIDALLQSDCGSDLNTAFEEFSIARFFLGDRADAPLASIENAEAYSSNPPLTGTVSIGRAPTHASPPLSSLPESYGVNYWEVSAAHDFSSEVTVTLAAEEAGPWALELFSVEDGGVVRADPADGAAELAFTPAPGETRILAVVRLGDETFDPAEIPEGADYELTFAPTVPFPEIAAIDPAEMARTTTAAFTISGDHFQEGAEVVIRPSGLTVDSVGFIDAASLEAVITAPPEAMLAYYTVAVVNPDGAESEPYEYLHLAEAAGDATAPNATDAACSCEAPGRTQRASLLTALF